MVTGAWAGALTGLLLGPLLAGLVHTAPQPGPWWAPWRPTGRRWADTSAHDRLAVTACAVVGAGLAGAGAGWGAAWPAFVVVGLAAGPLVVVDVRLHRLPDRIVLPTGALAAVLLALAALVRADAGPLLRALICAVVVLAVLGSLAGLARGAFGFGDVKTAAVLALLLGWTSVQAVVVGLWAGFVVAAVVALGLLVTRRAGWKSRIAFGPSLLLGALGALAALAF